MTKSSDTDPQVSIGILNTLVMINDRITSHGEENRNGVSLLGIKIDKIADQQRKDKEELLMKIQEVEILNLKDNHATNIKVASLSGIISIIVSLLIYWLKSKIINLSN